MCVAKAFEVPSPICWIVCMSGVGAVWDTSASHEERLVHGCQTEDQATVRRVWMRINPDIEQSLNMSIS